MHLHRALAQDGWVRRPLPCWGKGSTWERQLQNWALKRLGSFTGALPPNDCPSDQPCSPDRRSFIQTMPVWNF